jgi:hypothetical protein
VLALGQVRVQAPQWQEILTVAGGRGRLRGGTMTR